MIQRIQSVWLFLAGLAIISLLFFPMVTSTVGPVKYEITTGGQYAYTDGNKQTIDTFLSMTIMTVAVAVICFVNIFNFKKRFLQKRGIFVAIGLIFGLSFFSSRYADSLPGGLESANYDVGVFLPMMAIAFCALALRGIARDEKLIRSADRLR